MCAGIAQSVEQLIRNQQVVCSSHITSSRNDRGKNLRSFLLFKTVKCLCRDNDGRGLYIIYNIVLQIAEKAYPLIALI